jgi:histidyl-tRNA synthetase
MAADAEMCMMAADTMEALGIPRGSYVVKVWNRKLLDGLMDAVPELEKASPEERLRVLRSIDKFDRLGMKGVQQLLGPGRRDESGDFTEGAKLPVDANNFITSSTTTTTVVYTFDKLIPSSVIEQAEKSERPPFDFDAYRKRLRDYLRGRDLPAASEIGLMQLGELSRITAAAGYSDRVKIDPSVVRGLEYYTGPVYEVELTFPIEGEDGKPIRFGSVGGGGRYDGLIERFRGEPVPATGFSIGVSRLITALQHLGKIESKPEPGPVVVTVFPDIPFEHYQRLVAKLRDAEYAPGKKIRAELYLGDGKFGAQMKYADRRGSPCVVIQGGNEKAKGEIQIKDLILGAEIAGLSKDREDYLKKQAEAQFAVAENKLVDAVREVLARHDVKWS